MFSAAVTVAPRSWKTMNPKKTTDTTATQPSNFTCWRTRTPEDRYRLTNARAPARGKRENSGNTTIDNESNSELKPGKANGLARSANSSMGCGSNASIMKTTTTTAHIDHATGRQRAEGSLPSG